MSELPPVPTSGDDLGAGFPEPVTGAFRSSWREVLKEAAWLAVPVLLIFCGLGWLDGDTLLANIGVAGAGICTAVLAGVYRVWGAEFVAITPEALTVVKRGRRPVRVVWTELRDANYRTGQGGNSWVFRHGRQRTVVPERGFTSADWSAVCRGIYDWKASGPLAALPGVDTTRQRPGGTVFNVHQPRALFWGIPFFLLCGAFGVIASWEAYGEGSWLEDPMMAIGLPVIGFGLAGMGTFGLWRAARRVTFGPDALTVERYAGAALVIPYADVTDAWGSHVRTRRGTFSIGDRNEDSFHRLLGERLDADQVSGDLMLQNMAQLSAPWALVVALVLPVPLGLGLGWWFGLPSGGGLLLGLGLLVAAGVAYTFWSRRRVRRWKADGTETPETSDV